jgi:predicted metal-dependent RNase
MTFIVHGEPAAAEALDRKIQSELKWPTHIAKYLEQVQIS